MESTSVGQKEIIADINKAIIRFEKEFLGRGPLEVKSYLIDDMVLVRLKGVLTPAEHQLGQSSDPSRGRRLVKEMRQQLVESGRPLLDSVIGDIVGTPVISLHTDISTKTGERIIIFTFGENLKFED
jgi:uncharacterized protein YbcI